MPKITSINLRRGTTASWTSTNPVLDDGEIGWDSTAGKFKVGNGSSAWSALSYVLDSALAGKADAAPIAEKWADVPPDAYPQGYSIMSVGSTSGWPVAFSTVETVRQGANRCFQQLVAKTSGRVFIRAEGDANAWGPWSESAVVGHTHSKADVGLSNVDNTTDLAKPISTATQTALNGKISAFADPNADRIVFWDDSVGAFAALTATNGLAISGTSLVVNAASETVSGRVELATAAETTTGTDATRAVHTAGLKAQKGVANGLAGLDASAKVPIANLPSGVADGLATLDVNGKVPTAQLPAAQIGTSLMGTYSQRPAANVTAAGTIFYATDTMESYRCDGSAWTVIAAGSELGSAELRSFYQSTGGGGQWLDLPGMAVTFVAGERPLKVELTLDFCVTVGNTNAQARLLINNSVSMTEISAHQAYSHKWDTRSATVRWYGLIVGNIHTIKTQVKADTGAEIWVDGSTTKTSLLTVSGV